MAIFLVITHSEGVKVKQPPDPCYVYSYRTDKNKLHQMTFNEI